MTSTMSKAALIKQKLRAQRDGDMRKYADATNKLGDLFYNERRYDEAIDEYLEEVKACEILNDKLSCAVSHRKIGELQLERAEYTEALNHHNLYLEGVRELGNDQEEQRAFMTLGRTYLCYAESLPIGSNERIEALSQAEIANTKSIRLCARLKDIGAEEMATMRARGLLNLGLVYEAQSNFERAAEYCGTSVKICIKNKLHRDLYKAYCALGNIHERCDNSELALMNYDLAVKVDHADDIMKAEAQIAKATLHLKLGNWMNARKILVMLYPIQSLTGHIREDLERLLRIAVTLCRGEEKLNCTSRSSNMCKLYEEMGDAAVAAVCFDKALQYYHHMLLHAEKEGSTKAISDALISLAKTLQDAGRHEEALTFARRELELCSDPREVCRSALFLAEILVPTDASDFEIRQVYDLALEKAKTCKDLALEASVLKERLFYLRQRNLDDEDGIGNKLKIISETLEESESEKDASETRDIGADICLDDLSDLEGQNEEECERSIRPKVVRTGKRAMAVRRNEKGETKLHTECIKGNVQNVERLLANRHPVNVRDHCGWTPLHEAANHGFVEIVELLIKAGANVNTTSSEGITPLFDAASCGNIAVMTLLMKNGATVHSRTSNGETVLDALAGWRNRVGDDAFSTESEEEEYKYIYQELVARGVSVTNNRSKNNASRNHKLQNDDDESDSEDRLTVSCDPEPSAGEDYKQTIAKLRNRRAQLGPLMRPVTANEKITAPLIDSEQVLEEDWLDDDMGGISSKKKCISTDPLPSVKRKPAVSTSASESRSKRQRLSSDNELVGITSNICDEESCDSLESELSEIRRPERHKKRRRQSSLLMAGFSRNSPSQTPSPVTSRSPSPAFSHRPRSSFGKQTNAEEDLHLQVLIEERLFDLQLNADDSKNMTIEHITGEVAKKFEDNTGCKPQINLVAPDGEIITMQHAIENLLAAQNSLTLTSTVIDMDVPPISNRYSKICKSSNVDIDEGMIKCLKTCENTSKFRLRNRATSAREIPVLLKSLEYESSLQCLYLSGGTFCKLGKSLQKSMERLNSLQELHLRGCDIDKNCLAQLAKLPSQIKVLDLSYNPLGEESAEILHDLLSPLKNLQTLNLSSCQLVYIQPGTTNPGLLVLDVSWNKIGGDGIRSVLQYHMVTLNATATTNPEKSSVIIELLSHPRFSLETLESLELAFCNLSDLDVSNILAKTPNLATFIINGNPKLSMHSLTKLLQHEPALTHIDMSGCFEISEPADSSIYVANPTVCTLTINMKKEVQRSWLRLWKNHSTIFSLPHNVVMFKTLEHCRLEKNN